MVTVAVLAVAGLAGCGSDDGATAGSTAPGRGTTSPSTSSGPTPPESTNPPTVPGTNSPGTSSPTTETTVPVLPADGLAIRWTTRWWDPQLAAFGAPGQDIAVYADGTVVGASTVDVAAQPMVWPYMTGTIGPEGVQQLLGFAAEAGLLSPTEPVDGNSNVVGAPVTFVELHTAGGVFRHRVHALQTPPDPDTEYLSGLRAFVRFLGDGVAAAIDPNSAEYAQPTHVAVTAKPVEPTDSRVVDEWTGALDLATASGCAVTDDQATIELLRAQLAGAHFRQGERTYRVTAYQLIPGETACFDAAAAPDEPSTEPREALRVTTQPLFPVVPPFVGSGPEFVVYTDGTVLAPFLGAFDVQPMVWPYERGEIEPEAVAALLERADELGLLAPPEPQLPRIDVADAPLTTVVITAADGTFVHSVSALASPRADEPEYVTALRELVTEARAVTASGRLGMADYEPVALALAAVPSPVPQGHAPATEWPGAVRLAELATCTIVTDPGALAELGQQSAGLHYSDAGTTYRLAARVAFPGDTTC